MMGIFMLASEHSQKRKKEDQKIGRIIFSSLDIKSFDLVVRTTLQISDHHERSAFSR